MPAARTRPSAAGAARCCHQLGWGLSKSALLEPCRSRVRAQIILKHAPPLVRLAGTCMVTKLPVYGLRARTHRRMPPQMPGHCWGKCPGILEKYPVKGVGRRLAWQRGPAWLLDVTASLDVVYRNVQRPCMCVGACQLWAGCLLVHLAASSGKACVLQVACVGPGDADPDALLCHFEMPTVEQVDTLGACDITLF